MNIAVIGGGPAGLWFARSVKRADPQCAVTVFEQNPSDATYGFGVVFSSRALELLGEFDGDALREMTRAMEVWDDQTVVHRGEAIVIDGGGYAGIARIRLLKILQRMCEAAGVVLNHGERIPSVAQLDADLVVGADGAHSVVREAFASAFGTRVRRLTNRFAWYGVEAPFRTHTLTFRDHEGAAFVAHHYRYRPEMSTFLVECDARTWTQTGLDTMSEAERKRYVEQVFASELDGRRLVENGSLWRTFPVITNARWSTGRYVLIGDALRTAHFSIGSGTRLAMDDASALASALAATSDVARALELYESTRRPAVERFVGAAQSSFNWYEHLREKMNLAPLDLAYDYMRRTGRIDDERLRREAPAFMRRYEDYALKRSPPGRGINGDAVQGAC
jgi:2-polyprenyl-6-methoxyphenol hydroxylase-like FAD-dependent oxidoreductase